MVRRRRSPWAGFGLALITVAVIVVGAWLATRTPPAASVPSPVSPPTGREARVDWVADGDTLDVTFSGDQQRTRVRLLGIDAPEGPANGRPAQCLADEARAALLELAPRDGTVQVTDLGRDRFGRRLVALTTPTGTLVNAELVRRGLAAPLVVGRDVRLQDQIGAAQAEAAASEQGLHAWTGCTIRGRLATGDPVEARRVLDDLLADQRNALVQGLTDPARDQAIADARRLSR